MFYHAINQGKIVKYMSIQKLEIQNALFSSYLNRDGVGILPNTILQHFPVVDLAGTAVYYRFLVLLIAPVHGPPPHLAQGVTYHPVPKLGPVEEDFLLHIEEDTGSVGHQRLVLNVVVDVEGAQTVSVR